MNFWVGILTSAIASFSIGLLLGAAIQRWGDRERATEHHTKATLATSSSLDALTERLLEAGRRQGGPLYLDNRDECRVLAEWLLREPSDA